MFGLLGYVPTPKQQQFHDATEDDVLYGGAAGGGKSQALVMHALRAADWYPGIRVGIVRRSFEEHSENIIPLLARTGFAEVLGARWNGSSHELRFPNGSLVKLLYLENLADASRRQGGEYQLLEPDERTLLPPGAVDQLAERLRSVPARGVPVLGMRSSANPGGADHAAVKRRYIDATSYGETVATDEHGRTVRFIPARVSDNPHIDPGYRARLEAIPDPSRRKAMLDGDWDSFSGQVFANWVRDRFVVPNFPIPPTWERWCGIDYGYRAPWAVIWGALDEDGRMWLYRELYAREVGEAEQARRILAAEDDSETPTHIGDAAMWARRGDLRSVADVYAEEGLGMSPSDSTPGARLHGLARCHSYMEEAPACFMHRGQGWETCPRLHVFATCEHWLRTVPALPYDMRKVEDVDTKAEDHAYDAWRYLATAIDAGPEFPIFEAPAPRSAPDGTPLQRDFGPYAIPIEDEAPWLR